MPQHTIKFIIKQDGTVTEEVIGVVGKECQHITKSIENKLGNVIAVTPKPEQYLAQPIDNFWKQQTDVTLQYHKD